MATTTLMITMIKKEQHYDGWEMTFGGGFIILHEREGSNKPGGGGSGRYLRNRQLNCFTFGYLSKYTDLKDTAGQSASGERYLRNRRD